TYSCFSAPSLSKDEEENILYDLLINTEWPPETDTVYHYYRKQTKYLVILSTCLCLCVSLWTFFFLYFSPSSSTLPPGLVRLATKQLNWQLVLARVAWSHDCALLAYADSTGTVRVFDLMGSELFIIPPAMSFPGDFSYAAAGLMFLEYTASAQWSAELLVITYSGQLKSYLVSVGTNQGFQENHTFSFSAHYSNGITTAIYHPGHRLLLVGGCESGDSDVSRASRCGITAWRVLSGSPHYKQVTSYEDDISAVSLFRLFSRHDNEQDGVFRMSLSPDGTVLAVIHFSGSLSLWDIPSFKLRGSWKQEEQPGFDEINPEWKTSLEKRKKIKDKEQYQSLLDVSWWSETALILARCSGALTVSSVRTLKNLLGKSCEWFETSPRVTSAHDGGFLSLEVELYRRLKPHEDVNKTAFCEIPQLLVDVFYCYNINRSTSLRWTINKTKRFQLKFIWCLNVCVCSQIDNEEYGEALSLAQAYGLDSDLVYQRQWRKSTVSIASIQDYLSKIKKRSWVLHECVERVPENVDAAKELLQYGLKGTDLEALFAIGEGEDQGRFILSGDLDLDDAPYEDFVSTEEEMEQRKEREAKKRQELLKKVDFSKLTLEQKELCRSRLKLLCYLDRLATYEEILGGPHAAEQRFDAEFFKKFRNQNIVLSARTYARESNVQALDILFTYHGSELLQHRLAVLCNFPETTSPHEYSDLLPKGNLAFIPWEESRHRDLDWCEVPECRGVVEPNPVDDCHFLFEEQPELERFRSAKPSITLLTEWYLTRAQDIESNSRQVDCALSLVRLGKEQNIPGLEVLCDDLVTMETLVYETSCDLSLTLKELQQLRDIDKLRLLMKNSSEDRYVRNSFQWMVPFLHRCEGQRVGSASALLREYLVTLAKDDLTLPLKMFQHSKPDCHPKVIGDSDQLMSVALECIYSCERDDQLALCYDILECLPQRGYGPETDSTKALHDQVDTLEKHLSVAEVLEKHGLQKPISFVRNSQNSKEEAHQLMVRLTRHTGRKNPPVSETVWRGLLQDLLDMQQNVYTCLEPETCHQVFVESLLCSGREENVRLAGQLMHCSAVSEDTPVSVSFRGKAHARVSYSRSVELVLAAAREYFNSSATLSDPCMNLARSCLLLITDCPSLVQEEMDLISALSRLEQFGVKVLPLQVRLRTDRLSLIKECISQCPTAYRQSTLLLSLARLLRVAGDDEAKRKGQVLTLLAEQALRCQDFKASYIHCQDLMAAGYSDGWDVCAQLGQCEAYSQLSARQKLMAFALTHCPPSSIQNLLATSSSLQTQVLYQAVNYKIDPSQARRTGSELSEVKNTAVPGSINPTDLLHRTTARTLEVLTNTTMTTRAVLTAVSDSHWWRESLSLLRPLHSSSFASLSFSSVTSCNSTARRCFSAVITLKYSSFFSLSISSVISTVLLQLASDAFPKDMTLALAYLLALPQVLDANTCFEKQPPSALSLQLAAYYYSLQIYSRLAPCFKDKCSPLYRADPRELIRLVTKHVTDHAGCDWGDEELRVLIDQLRLYSERLTDFTQAQVLQGLGRGVDVQRFSSDNQYKKETILGLAETLDESVYGISRSLAQRYSIPLWEVHMTHLEFLFTDSGLSTKDIENRTEALGLFETLKTNPESFYTHMTKYVYPSIAGTDQLRLLFYFTLLENCGCASYFPQSAMNPDTHLKLLKKLKAVAVGLDYKKLTDEDSDPLKALEPVLTSQNVLSISKLAPRIPQKGGEALTSSAVHATWLHKLFWEGDQHVLKKAPQSDHDFLHAYDTCAKYFDRLLPVDSVNFMDAITFSPEAANKLSVESRLEITKRAQKALKGISDKSKKKGNDDRSENSASSFDSALTHIQQSLAHLETLSHSFPLSLKTSQELLQKYSRIYDLSRSEQSKVRHLAITMVMDGQPLERIEQLLAVSVGTSDLSVESVVQDAVERIITALSGDKDTLKDYADPLKVLEGIVAAVHTNVQSGGNMVTSEDMLAWLRPFCGDDSKAVRPRLEVLQILEHSFSLSDQDIHLLVFFRSQACEMKDVESEEQRNSLFLELLESSSKWEEFQHLMLLLQAWPPCVGYISSLLLNAGIRLPALKLMTESEDEHLRKLTQDQIKNITDVTEEVCDSELLSLLLNAGMLISCVDTALYSSLVSHMLAQGEWDVEKAAHDLHQAGHSAQAGSLLLSYRGSHPGQFTFNSALSVIRKWL
uniref:NBAS subunit of NRZ tethering complex n=1 Tax=Cyprinus carpio TaxID=7962 RepID=A0A8C1T408_CYPCA